MCVPCVYVVHNAHAQLKIRTLVCIPTCVDAASVLSTDGVETVADDDEPTKG